MGTLTSKGLQRRMMAEQADVVRQTMAQQSDDRQRFNLAAREMAALVGSDTELAVMDAGRRMIGEDWRRLADWMEINVRLLIDWRKA